MYIYIYIYIVKKMNQFFLKTMIIISRKKSVKYIVIDSQGIFK